MRLALTVEGGPNPLLPEGARPPPPPSLPLDSSRDSKARLGKTRCSSGWRRTRRSSCGPTQRPPTRLLPPGSGGQGCIGCCAGGGVPKKIFLHLPFPKDRKFTVNILCLQITRLFLHSMCGSYVSHIIEFFTPLILRCCVEKRHSEKLRREIH